MNNWPSHFYEFIGHTIPEQWLLIWSCPLPSWPLIRSCPLPPWPSIWYCHTIYHTSYQHPLFFWEDFLQDFEGYLWKLVPICEVGYQCWMKRPGSHIGLHVGHQKKKIPGSHIGPYVGHQKTDLAHRSGLRLSTKKKNPPGSHI